MSLLPALIATQRFIGIVVRYLTALIDLAFRVVHVLLHLDNAVAIISPELFSTMIDLILHLTDMLADAPDLFEGVLTAQVPSNGILDLRSTLV